MFVCIAGKNNIAINVTEYILSLKLPVEIGAIFNKTETGEDGWQRSFKRYATIKGIKEYKLEDIYEIPDLVFISLEFDRIIKPEKFKDARLYNIHFSLLPRYKGMYTSVFPILNDEERVGVTFHKIDAGIDTGDIIAQKSFPLDDITSRELYFNYIKYGTQLVLEHIEDVLAGKEQAVPQKEQDSSYYSKKSIDYNNLQIDLEQTAHGIHNQIRAFNFREYQLPYINNTFIIGDKITNIRSNKKPGTVVMENENSLMMSTIDYYIILYKDRFEELLTACETGNINLVKEICSVREHINAKNIRGWSPLMVATYHNKKDIVKHLISIGANIWDVNNNGTNLLMYAKDAYKIYKDSFLFQFFRGLGLSENMKDFSGHNLLYYMEIDDVHIPF